MSTNFLVVRHNKIIGSDAAMALKDTIKKERESRGWSQQTLAKRIGVAQNTIMAIESGKTRKTKYLPDLARAFGMNIDELDPPSNGHFSRPLTSKNNLAVGDRNLPVYASVEGGRGYIIVSSDPTEYVARPEPLGSVPDGYGIQVVGDSMTPAFEPGDIVLVHPHLTPIPDCDVVLYAVSEEGEHRVTVKRLVRITSSQWHLKQHKPAREFVLERSEWPKCHRVVGKYSRR